MLYQEFNNDTIIALEEMDPYTIGISQHLRDYALHYTQGLSVLLNHFKDQLDQDGDTFLIGSGYCSELVDHANVDLLKFANIRVCEARIPTLTAYSNDYPSSSEFSEYFKHHRVNENTLLILISLGDFDPSINKTWEVIKDRGGRGFLITNNAAQAEEFQSEKILIQTEDVETAGDVAQSFMHYITLASAVHNQGHYDLDWALSYSGYAAYLTTTIQQMPIKKAIESIGDSILLAIKQNKRLFVFGNGGSAAIASYFVNQLTGLLHQHPTPLTTVVNLGQYVHSIQESIKTGSYKSSVYSDLMKKMGITEDEMIVGISTSGNSENIILPFAEYQNTKRVAVLGFGDGGKLGTSALVDHLVIVPDVDNKRSYAVAEDCQRIIFTCVLKYLRQKLDV